MLRKTIPVSRRVLGQSHDVTLTLEKIHAEALYRNPGATLDDLRKAVRALEDLERTGRRVLGSSHPRVRALGASLERSRAALRARESPLPWPWEAHCNDAGALYFHNRETGESEWTLPDELLARETPHRVNS